MSDEKIGKFQVLETLGTGAHSTILRIRRAVDAKEYALKVVPISQHGNPSEIAQVFGGPDELKNAVDELQRLLYAA